jgi:Zn-dependent protease with chaperone function
MVGRRVPGFGVGADYLKRGRAMAAIFSVNDFLHPLDLSARGHLEGIPLLQSATKKYLSAVQDRRLRQYLLCSAVRLGPTQLADVYRVLPPICDAFGIPEPELYLTTGEANAYTIGHTRPAIVISNLLLESLADDEIQAVLAHECGHILAEHTLYRQMAQAMLAFGQAGAAGMGIGSAAVQIASSQIRNALMNWYRKSELTADRAAVAYLRGPEPMQRALFHLMGVPKWMPVEISFDAFIQQAAEFDELAESKWDRLLARGVESANTHPAPALRIKELGDWAKSAAFGQLLAIAESGHLDRRAGCAQCGLELAADWLFCQRCGRPVPQLAVPADGAA